MNLRTRIHNFLTPGAHLSSEQQRYFVLLTIAGVWGFLLHVLYIPLFYWMGVNVLTIHSALALFVWAFVIWSGRIRFIKVPWLTTKQDKSCELVLFRRSIFTDSGLKSSRG
jgi:hypothetical protein